MLVYGKYECFVMQMVFFQWKNLFIKKILQNKSHIKHE